jgi:hypothetical protein
MVSVREPDRDLTSAPARRPGMIARRPRPPGRYPVSLRPLASRHKQRPEPPTAPRTGPMRPYPMPPSLTALPGVPRPTPCLAGCRRFRRHPRLIPAQATPCLREPRARRALRGFPDRRGPRPPRRTSGAQGRGRLVLLARGPADQRGQPVQGVSGQAAPVAALTSRPRDLRAGRPRRGLRDRARPGRVRLGRADPGRVLAVRVLARGQAITRSARPRPAWGRRLRPGLRGPLRLARPPGVRDSRPARRAGPAVLVVLVREDAAQAGLACPMAGLVRAVLVRAALGRAR